MVKSEQEILNKLKIDTLNEMQKEALEAINTNDQVVILSPTGTGKTLAFLLPLILKLDVKNHLIQAMILVPSRELAIQIEQVVREMGAGFKVNAVYGGRPSSKDIQEFQQPPAILIGTPGRIADHLRRESFDVSGIKTLILDEFDKSLEIGFEGDMKEIVKALPFVEKRILTSATQKAPVPPFAKIENPVVINYLSTKTEQLTIKTVPAPDPDKFQTLLDLLSHVGNQPGIIFCNFKDTIEEVSEFLQSHRINHGCFYGGLEQRDRERALIKFRNGTYQLLLATDLAARGLDIPELKFIIHFHLPFKKEEFTHRNGRTARMNQQGSAYVLHYEKEKLPDFITPSPFKDFSKSKLPKASKWCTLFVSGGRKDKISKGDIAGLFMKQGNLSKEDLGVIELKQDCTFVAVNALKAEGIVDQLNNTSVKKRKVRISIV